MKKTLILIALLFLVAGCEVPVETAPNQDAATRPVATATPAPTATPTAVQEMVGVILVTEAPEPTDTPTATATDTPAPTDTPTPTATATDTPTITPTPTMTPTPAPQVQANGKNVNVRRGPGTVFSVMGVLRDGQTASVIARGPKGWLQIDLDGKTGWIYSGVVEVIGPIDALAVAEDIPTPPPTPTPVPPTATPAPAGPQLPPKQDVVHLTKDTRFPVRANRFIGWGYEIVDASEKWDIVMYRDVFGYVLHEFYGDALYKQHPHGMRVTFLDCVPETMKDGRTLACYGTQTPVALFSGRHKLFVEFGDGVGSVAAAGCAIPNSHYYDPQECFIGLGPIDAGHLTDIVVSTMIEADGGRVGYKLLQHSPDFSQPPFTPHLGIAVRDDQLQQWRWKDPFIRIVPQQP